MASATPREKILLAAKTEFYNKGYLGATLRNIAKEADVQPALITYYYKSKFYLLSEIYSSFQRNILKLLSEYPELKINNSLFKQILTSYIYYSIIFNDEKNRRVYQEVIEKYHSNYYLHKEITDEVYMGYVEDFNLSMSKTDFKAITVMRSGARSAFFRNYLNGELGELSITEIVHYVETVTPSLMGIDRKEIDSWLVRADHVIKEIDYSSIKFLI